MRLAREYGFSESEAALLHEEARICRELFARDPMREEPGKTRSLWPEILGERRYALSQSQQDAIRDGERVFQALRLAITGRKSADGGDATPAVTWDDLRDQFQDVKYRYVDDAEEVPNAVTWVESKTTETGATEEWEIDGQPSIGDGSGIALDIFSDVARLAGAKLLELPDWQEPLSAEQDHFRRWLRLLTLRPHVVQPAECEDTTGPDDRPRRIWTMTGIVDASHWWCGKFRNSAALRAVLKGVVTTANAAELPAKPTPRERGQEAKRTENTRSQDFRHSPDFSSVVWGKALFTFNARQAACVCIMWLALDEGTPYQSQEYILENAADVYRESSGLDQKGVEGLQNVERLRDVFKDKGGEHAAWNTMILGDKKGNFRLQPPPDFEDSQDTPR